MWTVAALLLATAAGIDVYLVHSNADYGAYKVTVNSTAYTVDCTSSALPNTTLEDVIGENDPNEICVHLCKTKQAVAVTAPVLAFLAVAVSSDIPRVWQPTGVKWRMKVAAVLGICAMLCSTATLVLFGIQSQVPEAPGITYGICAYKPPEEDEAAGLSTGAILMAVGGGLAGVCGCTECCVDAPDDDDTDAAGSATKPRIGNGVAYSKM